MIILNNSAAPVDYYPVIPEDSKNVLLALGQTIKALYDNNVPLHPNDFSAILQETASLLNDFIAANSIFYETFHEYLGSARANLSQARHLLDDLYPNTDPTESAEDLEELNLLVKEFFSKTTMAGNHFSEYTQQVKKSGWPANDILTGIKVLLAKAREQNISATGANLTSQASWLATAEKLWEKYLKTNALNLSNESANLFGERLCEAAGIFETQSLRGGGQEISAGRLKELNKLISECQTGLTIVEAEARGGWGQSRARKSASDFELES